MDTDVVSGGNTTGGSSAPASFAEADWSTPVASPATESAAETSTPLAAEQPESPQAAVPQQPDERSPFIPRARFDEVVTARKQAEETLKSWEGYEWAKNPQVQQIVQMVAQSKGDPMAFFAQQFSDLSGHPVYGPQLRTFLGQQFGALRQSKAELTPPEPDIAVYNDQGQVVGKTYSDTALAQRDAYLRQQLLQEVQSQIAPKLQTLDQINAERQQQQAEAKAQSFAASFMTELQALPGFDLAKHGPALAAELQSYNLSPNAHPAEVNAAAYRAYAKVVLPTLNQSAQTQLLDNLKQQAAASTATNPASAGGGSRASVTSFHDKSLVW